MRVPKKSEFLWNLSLQHQIFQLIYERTRISEFSWNLSLRHQIFQLIYEPEFLSSREIYPYGIKYSSSYMNVPKFLSSREIYPYHTKIFQLERTKISEFSWNLSIHQNIPAHVSLMHRKIQWQRWNFITKCHILILETWGIIIWAKICLFDWIVSCIFGQTHLGNLTYLSDCLQLDLYTKEIIQPENN